MTYNYQQTTRETAKLALTIATWNQIIDRIRAETSKCIRSNNDAEIRNQTVAAIKIVLLVDYDSNPITWVVEGHAVEPTKRAKALLDLL